MHWCNEMPVLPQAKEEDFWYSYDKYLGFCRLLDCVSQLYI